MKVYERVRAYLESNGLKQKAVAQKAGYSITTFNAMMMGKRIIYADDLRAICIALNVCPEIFIDPDDAPTPPPPPEGGATDFPDNL